MGTRDGPILLLTSCIPNLSTDSSAVSHDDVLRSKLSSQSRRSVGGNDITHILGHEASLADVHVSDKYYFQYDGRGTRLRR